MATVRQASADTCVAGVDVAKGTAVAVVLGGANRDPSVFEDPDTYDIIRSNSDQHLSFSFGAHLCLGAGLARLEARLGLRLLFERFPDLRVPCTGIRRPTPHPPRLRIPPRRPLTRGVLLLLRHPPGVRTEASGGRTMGDGDELSVDYDKLNKVHQDLNEQKNLVQSINLGSAPAVSAFGGSAKGEWLANAVTKGHENIVKAKDETVQGLEKYASAVDDAINDITETDEGAAMVAKKMSDALAVMSNPLVIFSGKIPMPF